MKPTSTFCSRSIFVFIIFLLYSFQINAQSLLGAELGYKFSQDSGNTVITLTTYSFCSADSHPDLLVKLSDGKNVKNLLLSYDSSEDITPICKYYKTPCNSDTPDYPYGIRKNVFTGKINMSDFEDCFITIGWNGGKRSDSINNLAPGQDLYVKAKFNICVGNVNNGPVFEFSPIIFIRPGNKQSLFQSVYADEEGDSLVYELDTPKTEANKNAIYNPYFNAQQPFDSNSIFLYNKQNGQLTINKSYYLSKNVSSVAYKVTKWGRFKNGSTFFKGEVTREMASFVIVMKRIPNNNPPQLSGINGSSISTDFFTPGMQKCFTISCFDPDKGDSLKVTWNNDVPGATFIVEKNKKHPRAQFCWTPGNIPKGTFKEYTFIVTVTDDACPYPSTAQREFKIILGGYPDADAGENVISCIGDTAQLKATGGKAYYWFPSTGLSNPKISNPKAIPKTTTKYYVDVRDSIGKMTISSIDSVTVYVFGDCVWPGETNRDMIPEMKDILPIGVSYNIDGFKRQYATTNWQAEKCLDWNTDIAEKINNKHADCNGDGYIDFADVSVVLKNYTQNPDTNNYFTSADSTKPEIGIVFNKKQFSSNEIASASIFLGTSYLPAKDIYGLALRLGYDTTIIKPESLQMETQDSWLIEENHNEIKRSKNFPGKGIFDIGLCKTNHISVDGSGNIAKLNFQLKENIPPNTLLKFSLLDGKIINAAYEDKQVRLSGSNENNAVINKEDKTDSSVTKNELNVKIFPNPASEFITIGDEDEHISEIRLYNALGQLLLQEKTQTQKKHSINIESISSGIYFITVLSANDIKTLEVSVIK